MDTSGFRRAQQEIDDTSRKQLGAAQALGMHGVLPLVGAYALYFLLQQLLDFDSGIAKSVVDTALRGYLSAINAMVWQGIVATAFVSVFYIPSRIVSLYKQKFIEYFPMIAYIGVFSCAGYIFFDLVQAEGLDGKKAWLNTFINTSSTAIIWATWFYDQHFGDRVAVAVLCVINIAIYILTLAADIGAALLGAIPFIGGILRASANIATDLLKGIFNVTIISDLFVLIAVSSVGKYLIEFIFAKIEKKEAPRPDAIIGSPDANISETIRKVKAGAKAGIRKDHRPPTVSDEMSERLHLAKGHILFLYFLAIALVICICIFGFFHSITLIVFILLVGSALCSRLIYSAKQRSNKKGEVTGNGSER